MTALRTRAARAVASALKSMSIRMSAIADLSVGRGKLLMNIVYAMRVTAGPMAG